MTFPLPQIQSIVHHHEVRVTEFRVDRAYVFWYKNIATFTVTVFIPLCCLIYWNTNTVRFMQRRRRVNNLNSNNNNIVEANVNNNNNNNNNEEAVDIQQIRQNGR